MGITVKERNGLRRFERLSRWNAVDYTIISDRNKLAEYADNYGTGEKLTLTFFKWNGHTYPLGMFGKLMEPITLEDFTHLHRQSVVDCDYFLEINSTKDKVRLYRKVT